MFKVKYKYGWDPKPYIVYSVCKVDDETTKFLVFDFDGWHWYDADLYEPYEEKN